MLPVSVSKYQSIILYQCSLLLRLVTLSLSQGLQNYEQLALAKAVPSCILSQCRSCSVNCCCKNFDQFDFVALFSLSLLYLIKNCAEGVKKWRP